MSTSANTEATRLEALRAIANGLKAAKGDCMRILDCIARGSGMQSRNSVPLSEVEDIAFRVVTYLFAAISRRARRIGPPRSERQKEELRRDLEMLRRLDRALRPVVDGRTNGQAVVLALNIIGQHLDTRIAGMGPPRRYRVVRDLARRVHDGFGALNGREQEMCELFERRTGGKGRKTKDGEPTRITDVGILIGLNRLAGYPLGRLDDGKVDRAIQRWDKPMK